MEHISLIRKISSMAAVLVWLAGCGNSTGVDPAAAVFINGDIYVGHARNPWVSAVAIEDKRFVYVGNDASAFVGSETQVFDLRGRMVIPGIIDAHTHPGLVALSSGQVSLDDTSTREAMMDSIRRMVAENPGKEVLLGGFWPNEYFDVTGPRKEELDRIEANRPVILYDDWSHTVWANSRALEQANVTRDTKDIVPGFSFYQKDENGEPTGWITESATSVFVNKFQSVTPAVEQTLLEILEYYRSVGVTTVLDTGNFGLDREVYAAVSRLDKNGQLPVRYHGAYTLFLPDDLADAVETLKQLGKDFNSENVRIDTLKIFFDGVLETRTAALSQDYLDTPGNDGEALLSRQQVSNLILNLEEEGLNLHIHAVGDRATTTLLDAIQDSHDSLSRAPTIRITICHLEVVKETDFARFRELGVIANFTPHWVTGGDLSWVAQGIGDAVFDMQRSQPLISDGAVVAFSSDITTEYEWTTDRANPFLGMQVGHNRQDVGVSADGEFLPPMSERLQRDDLLNGYTSNAAYQLGRSDEIGTIAVGLFADFVVLDRNLFEVDRYEMHRTKPVAVVMNGDIVQGEIGVEKENMLGPD